MKSACSIPCRHFFGFFLLLLLFSLSAAEARNIDINQGVKKIPPALVPEINKNLPARRVGVYWSGLHIADLFTEVTPKGKDKLEIKSVIHSYGVARLITKYQSEVVTTVLRKGSSYQPLSMSLSFKMRYGDRRIDIKYTEDGSIISEQNVPKENRAKRKPVPEKMKKGAQNPLSAAFEARARIIAIMSDKSLGKTFSISMYDGRRLSELQMEVRGIDKKGRVHVTLKEHPVAGWTNNELREKAKRNPIIHIYLDTQDYLPVYASGESAVGSAHGSLNAKCASLKECMP